MLFTDNIEEKKSKNKEGREHGGESLQSQQSGSRKITNSRQATWGDPAFRKRKTNEQDNKEG